MNLPDWALWAGVVVLALVMVAIGIYMIRLTAKLPELIRAFVTVICGGLLVIFAGFRVITKLNMPESEATGVVPAGFDIVPLVLQTSLMTGVVLAGYLVGVLIEERRLTRSQKEKPILSEANG